MMCDESVIKPSVSAVCVGTGLGTLVPPGLLLEQQGHTSWARGAWPVSALFFPAQVQCSLKDQPGAVGKTPESTVPAPGGLWCHLEY